MALVDLIGFRSAIFISKWLGRKRAIMFYMGFAAFFMINIILMEYELSIDKTGAHFNFLSFGGKMFSAASLAVVDCFTSESYPTSSRSTGVGLSNLAASVAAILAPQMAYFGSST